jgi:hypothetical protein
MPAFDRIQHKLKHFKKYFKGWGFNLQGENREIKEKLREELLSLEQLEEEINLTLEQIQRKVTIDTTLFSMMEEEELYWHKRSHSVWLHKGDNNAKFFHMVSNGRKRKNTIMYLKSKEGRIEGEDNLLKHATDYYKCLFGHVAGSDITLHSDLWEDGEKVSDSDNDEITKPFSESEIKEALVQMEKNKAAGPVGIPIEFYQLSWEYIKKDIPGMFSDLHAGVLDISRINYGVITLLPKVSDAEKIQQYRPICLLNCLYKWVTKVFTVMLEKIDDNLILQNQTAFMKGRNIMSGIMALHEILHETKKSGEVGIVLKLDFEKAYDKVSWKFLLDGLDIRGFIPKWCNWIKQVVSGGTVCVKLNNKLGPLFMCHKGVRQGDPLTQNGGLPCLD